MYFKAIAVFDLPNGITSIEYDKKNCHYYLVTKDKTTKERVMVRTTKITVENIIKNISEALEGPILMERLSRSSFVSMKHGNSPKEIHHA